MNSATQSQSSKPADNAFFCRGTSYCYFPVPTVHVSGQSLFTLRGLFPIKSPVIDFIFFFAHVVPSSFCFDTSVVVGGGGGGGGVAVHTAKQKNRHVVG
jgi:hypothetical protein